MTAFRINSPATTGYGSVSIATPLRKMCGLVCFVYVCAYPSGLVCCSRLLVVPVVIVDVGDFKFHVRRQCLLITLISEFSDHEKKRPTTGAWLEHTREDRMGEDCDPSETTLWLCDLPCRKCWMSWLMPCVDPLMPYQSSLCCRRL